MDNQHENTHEKSSHAPSSHEKNKYITHVHTQAKREYDNQDECNKDGMLKNDQDNIQVRESTHQVKIHTTMSLYM